MNELQSRLAALVADRPLALSGARLAGLFARLERPGRFPRAGLGDGRMGGGGTAVIPIRGFIDQHPSELLQLLGGTDLDSVNRALSSALADRRVERIVLDIDSPGGGVFGVADAADRILRARAVKPVWAVANSVADSGAYWLASQATALSAAPGGQVGSIGVIAVHLEQSRALAEAGVDVTMIRRPENKGAGNSFEPLGASARAHLQRQVDSHYDDFLSAVARGRGVSPGVVQARFGGGMAMLAKRARAAGMVDRVATLSEVLAASVLADRASAGGGLTAYAERLARAQFDH